MVIPDDIQRAFDSYLSSIGIIEWHENDEENDEKQTSKLVHLLKPFPESEKLAFIQAGLLSQNPVVGMGVAKLCLKDTESFRAVIEGGFPYLGSAQIRYWLEQSLLHVDKSELLTYINELSASPGMKRMAMFYFKGLTKPR